MLRAILNVIKDENQAANQIVRGLGNFPKVLLGLTET